VATAAEDDLCLIVHRPVHWTPDGKRLTCGSRDPAIRIWHSSGTPAKSWATPGRWTHQLFLLPSGKQLASCSWPEQRTRIWDLDGTELTLETEASTHTRNQDDVPPSLDGRTLAQTSDGVQVYDGQNTQCVELNGACLEPGSAAWSPDGTRIACPTHFNTVIVWDATTGQVEWVGLPLENAKSATVAADGRLSTDDRDAFDKRYCFVMKDAEGKAVFLNSREFEVTLNRN
jgi:WD40 repeat protein